jgi:23S rRNA pseudouridine1911/1915/1917 synthase
MNNIKEVKILKDSDGKRADLALLDFMPELTRTSAKKIFVEGIVKVNELEVKPNYKVNEGDTLCIDLAKINAYLNQTSNSVIKPSFEKISIIFEDKNIVVVNKPEGIVSHPVTGHREDSVLNRLVGRNPPSSPPFIKEGKGGFVGTKLRLVHRLDRDTSGVLLVAKNIEAQQFYSWQFEHGKAHKTYYAVVEGDFKKYLRKKNQDSLQVTTYISRVNNNEKIYHNTSAEKGLLAKTKFYFIDYWYGLNGQYALVKCEPETGRTHQIRVHLSSIGFPIVGDPWYQGIRYKRLMLHAFKLAVTDKNENQQEFRADLPKEFIN